MFFWLWLRRGKGWKLRRAQERAVTYLVIGFVLLVVSLVVVTPTAPARAARAVPSVAVTPITPSVNLGLR